MVLERVWASTWWPSRVLSSLLKRSVIAAHVKIVALHEWLENLDAAIDPIAGSKSSCIQQVASHVVMQCFANVWKLSFQEGRKGFDRLKCSRAFIKDEPHALSAKKRPTHTKGSKRVFDSFVIDVLCFSVSASNKTIVAKLSQMLSMYMASNHLEHAKMQKRIAPLMTRFVDWFTAQAYIFKNRDCLHTERRGLLQLPLGQEHAVGCSSNSRRHDCFDINMNYTQQLMTHPESLLKVSSRGCTSIAAPEMVHVVIQVLFTRPEAWGVTIFDNPNEKPDHRWCTFQHVPVDLCDNVSETIVASSPGSHNFPALSNNERPTFVPCRSLQIRFLKRPKARTRRSSSECWTSRQLFFSWQSQ